MPNSRPLVLFYPVDFGEGYSCSSSCDRGKTKSTSSLKPKSEVWQKKSASIGIWAITFKPANTAIALALFYRLVCFVVSYKMVGLQ